MIQAADVWSLIMQCIYDVFFLEVLESFEALSRIFRRSMAPRRVISHCRRDNSLAMLTRLTTITNPLT
jgi:hypothetical protein